MSLMSLGPSMATLTTTITVTRRTAKLLEELKVGGESYDDVIGMLLASHPNELTMAELTRRFREGRRVPIEDLIARSRALRAEGR